MYACLYILMHRYSHSGNDWRAGRTVNPFVTARLFLSPESCTKTLGQKRLRCTDAVSEAQKGGYGQMQRPSKYVNNSRNGSNTYMYACIYIHTNIHINIHTNIHTHTHTYMHTYIHTYIHTYTGSWREAKWRRPRACGYRGKGACRCGWGAIQARLIAHQTQAKKDFEAPDEQVRFNIFACMYAHICEVYVNI